MRFYTMVHSQNSKTPASGSNKTVSNQMFHQNPAAMDFEMLCKMHILIVDDTDDNVDLVKAMLSKSGFNNLLTAKNGRHALDCLRQNPLDEETGIGVILMDIMMPEMDGYDLCRIIHNQDEWADIPIIMITANSMWQEKVARTSFEAGASDIMFKPIRRVELIPRVISALSLKRERALRKQHERALETELAERKIMEARLQFLVGHDDLTGLSNRRSLEHQLARTIELAKSKGVTSTLFYLDLDQFRVVNNTEGHLTGDQLLVNVANILRQILPRSAMISRISSDEFAALITDISESSALAMAEHLRHVMENFSFLTNNITYHIGTSIGLTMIYPEENLDASDILARADQACFVAKTQGRNLVHLFSHDDTQIVALRSQVHWAPRIRDALSNNKFRLFFQPVLNIKSNNVSHYETLIRMLDDNGEIILPDNFIPVAEEMGIMQDIDFWVVDNAIEVLRQRIPAKSTLSLAINLSSHAFKDTSLVPFLKEKIESTGVKPNLITFEITETAAIANFRQTREIIKNVRQLGFSFALDDFGSGFNSFNYIREFPVDYLKIDGSFIINLHNDPVNQALVKSMIKIAHTLNKQTIAEFVEGQETLDLLNEYGVDFAQGNYIGEPRSEMDNN